MKRFRQWALISSLATYFAIFVGGLVRVSGAGLGCPDWPKCFGRWIPPLNVSQLPPEIDPSLFNFTLAWIEYLNRLAGVLLGLLIVITALLAIRYYRRVPRILYPTLAAALLVAFQGWQGGQVVASELKPLLVSIHMGIAFMIASLLIYVTQQAYYREQPGEEKEAQYAARANLGVALLWVLGIVQIVLGTQVRSAIEMVARDYPYLMNSEWLGKVGAVTHIHTLVGVVVAVGSWQVVTMIMKQSRNISALVRQAGRGIIILVSLQVLVGAFLAILGVPEVMQVFHLWLAGLYIGAVLILYSAIRQSRRAI